MFLLSVISLVLLAVIAGTFFVECKLISQLPTTNSFYRWWRKHIIGVHSKH